MAYGANEQFLSTAGAGSAKRAFSSSTQPKTFASGSGTLAALTPVAYNTSSAKWVLFQSGGANGAGTISGFIWPDALTLDGANDTLAQVMMKGRVHLDDIPIVAGYTLAQLKTALNAGVRNLGFIIEGLEGFH